MTNFKKNDIIEEEIFEDGYVKNTVLHRRWIMAQTFKLLNSENGWDSTINYNYDYKYQLSMLLEEFNVQAKLYESNENVYNERNMFFNKALAIDSCKRYIKRAKKFAIDGARYSELEEEYVVPITKNHNINIKDFYGDYLRNLESALTQIMISNSPRELFHSYKLFYKAVPKTNHLPAKKDLKWKDAYKGAGAFYTLKNMIKFHDCVIEGYDREESLEQLDELLYGEYKEEVWRFHILLLEVIKHNNFNFSQRMKELYE